MVLSKHLSVSRGFNDHLGFFSSVRRFIDVKELRFGLLQLARFTRPLELNIRIDIDDKEVMLMEGVCLRHADRDGRGL
jgi:hypothetical protein